MRTWLGPWRLLLTLTVFLGMPGFAPHASAATLDQSAWRVVYVDSEEVVGEDGEAENAFDGLPQTFWHTQWFTANPRHPHELQIDLGAAYNLTGFRYLPRQDGSPNGGIAQFELYVSADGVNWGSAVATGVFANSAAEKTVSFTAKTGRYVRLRALSEVNGNPWTSVAEFNLTDSRTVADPIFIPQWGSVTTSPFNLQPPGAIANPVLRAQHVTDVPTRFVADPFLFYENGVWHMFFELLRSDTNMGVIGLAQSYDGLTWSYKRVVLSESFHLSFPQVFKVDGNYYMIPETNQRSQVRLYQATNFPDGWSLVATLFSGRPFVDPQIVFHNGLWWIFVADTSDANTYLYYSPSLTSGWREHPASPIIRNDASKARGAGRILKLENNRLIRLAQKCDSVYGELVRAFEVDLLNETQYAEHEIGESPVLRRGQEAWMQAAAHQVDPWWNGTQWIAAIDGHSGDELWAIGIYTAGGSGYPNGVIDLPASDVSIPVGGQVVFAGSGTDPNGDLPLSYLWQFGSGSGIAPMAVEDPGAVQFNTAGVFNVTLTVTNARGLADPTPASRTVTVTSSGGGGLIPKTSWSLLYADSQETTAEDGRARNGFDGSASTFWHTQWYGTSPPPPHEIQINLGASYNITGFSYLPRQDGSPNGRIAQYEFYVSTDGVSWGSPVASGTFANNALEKTVSFSARTGRYVRLRALSEVNGNPWTSMAELNLTGSLASGAGWISKSGWVLKYADSQELVGENGAAQNAFDGNATTFWHTEWWASNPLPPHEIQINLGQQYLLEAFRYLPRQDGSPNGRIKQYEFYVSTDGVTWGSAVASGTFANDASEKTVTFTPKAGRFVRLRALSEVNNQPWTSMAELSLLGTLN